MERTHCWLRLHQAGLLLVLDKSLKGGVYYWNKDQKC